MDRIINGIELNTKTDVYDLIPVVDNIITNYCIDHDLQENDIFPSIWNDILIEIYMQLFKDTDVIRLTSTDKNYNQEKILQVYELIYKRICYKHCKEISLKAFYYMTGIDDNCLYDWENKPSAICKDLRKTIVSDNEESLEMLLHDRRYNAMKFLPSLNRKHNWALPGAKTDSGGSIKLSLADLKKLPEIAQNE